MLHVTCVGGLSWASFFFLRFSRLRDPQSQQLDSCSYLSFDAHIHPPCQPPSFPLTPSHSLAPCAPHSESFEPPHQPHLPPSTRPSSSCPLPFQHKKRWTHGLLATTMGRYASRPVIGLCLRRRVLFFFAFLFSFFVFFS